MTMVGYLAMTAAEIQAADVLPSKLAWMACHFASYSTGLSNLPTSLPENAMVILNDRTPVLQHDPGRILEQLLSVYEACSPAAFLLDFQRPGVEATEQIAKILSEKLPCPVGVSDLYAQKLSCPVFLSLPLRIPLEKQLKSWQGRQIWLEAALDAQSIIVSSSGTRFLPCQPDPAFRPQFSDDTLNCGYQIQCLNDQVRFQLQRSKQQLVKLLADAQTLGVTTAVGLYQQLGAGFFET